MKYPWRGDAGVPARGRGGPRLPGTDMTTTEIETARLRLRRFTLQDLDALTGINSDPEVMRFIGNGNPATPAQTKAALDSILNHWEKHGFGLWAVEQKKDRSVAGFCGLKYLDRTEEIEVGYRLARNFWGMGFATEGGSASLRYGWDVLKLQRIVAVVQPGNSASQRVLEKIGLRFVSRAVYYNSSVLYYEILKT